MASGGVSDGLGFSGLKVPTGYGSVQLRAAINNIDLGLCWSKSTTYSEGTEHAEDSLIDYIEYLFFYKDFIIEKKAFPAAFGPTDVAVMNSILGSATLNLVVVGLTASPCSTEFGTNKKCDMEGCTERFIRLKHMLESMKVTCNFSIVADHLYQPSGVVDAKGQSMKAATKLMNHGIKIQITK